MRQADSKAEAFSAHRRGDLGSAERLYRDLLRATPSDPELLHYLGVVCYQTRRLDEAAACLRQALKSAPGALPTLQLLARICEEIGDADGALHALDQYLAARPDDVAMRGIKAQQLARLGRWHEAEPLFLSSAQGSGNAALFHDLGFCRQLQGNLRGAADAYREALKRGHDNPKTSLWLAQCLRATGDTKDYYETIADAAQKRCDDIEILIEAQSARRYVCDWDAFEQHQPQLRAALERVLAAGNAGPDIPPGILNFLEIDEATIAAVAGRYACQLTAAGATLRQQLPARTARGRRDRIRLGYLSTDFFMHAIGSLVQDLFACHDRDRFEVYGYSLRHQPDAVQTRIAQGCDVYRNLSGHSADAIARAIMADEIDILIDLAGYTSAAQPTVLAARPAPLQMSWLGYLGTSGGAFIDYIIADATVLPPTVAVHYNERVIRLPRFLVASPLTAATERPSREQAGLGTEGIVFCSFNQPYKLDRATFCAWMEILRCTPDSRLWLYAPDTDVCGTNLRREAQRLGITAERLVFAPRTAMADHIARTALADLSLDPFHISGGATSVATLAAGVPILTLRGDSFLARMGSSLNESLGLRELDCTDRRGYVDKALALAIAPADLAQLKHRLTRALESSRLFDTAAFARTLEAALQVAWGRRNTGQPPIDIPSA